MTGRHWLRRDVLLPIFYVIVFGAGLYWLSRQLNELPAAAESTLVAWLVRIMFGVYFLLVLITVRHVLSTYDLERYDPGNKASLKRLMRRRRYKLSKRPIPLEGQLIAFEQQLHNMGYVLETESRVIGRVFCKTYPPVWMLEQRIDRVMVVQHDPLNVIMVDQVLQDCIRYVRSQVEKPSQRNQLILVTRMMNTAEAASAAAGVVNFLGKFKDGSLGVMLLAVCQHRLFYPADRTLQPRLHRWFQDILHLRFLTLIRQMQRSHDRPDPENLAGHTRRLGEHESGPLFTRIGHEPADAETEESEEYLKAEHLKDDVNLVQRQDLPFDPLDDSVEPEDATESDREQP